MEYYKSDRGGVPKVYSTNPASGMVTTILNYKDLGVYNVLNQDLPTDSTSGQSEYERYVSSLTPSNRQEFLTVWNLANTFMGSL